MTLDVKRQRRWPPWTTKFLLELRNCGSILEASNAAGISRQRAYQLKDYDPEFRTAWENAHADAVDSVEASAWRRARDGVVRLKFDKDGNALKDPRTGEVYEERQYSDTLAKAILEAYKKEYRRDDRPPVNILVQVLEQQANLLGISLETILEGTQKALAGDVVILPERDDDGPSPS